jgi:hypothetical protein
MLYPSRDNSGIQQLLRAERERENQLRNRIVGPLGTSPGGHGGGGKPLGGGLGEGLGGGRRL